MLLMFGSKPKLFFNDSSLGLVVSWPPTAAFASSVGVLSPKSHDMIVCDLLNKYTYIILVIFFFYLLLLTL